MLYEFMCGELPFGENLDNIYEIYEIIQGENLKFVTKYNTISILPDNLNKRN